MDQAPCNFSMHLVDCLAEGHCQVVTQHAGQTLPQPYLRLTVICGAQSLSLYLDEGNAGRIRDALDMALTYYRPEETDVQE